MARADRGDGLIPSLLDRLTDNEPDVSTEPAWRQTQDSTQYRRSVLRDVENLLNTRCGITDVPGGCYELAQSVLTYGLPDFTSAGIGSEEERDHLRLAVRRVIERFEPRLADVRVTLRAPDDSHDRAIQLTIEAVLMVDPEPLPITFDTLVEPSSGTCTVT